MANQSISATTGPFSSSSSTLSLTTSASQSVINIHGDTVNHSTHRPFPFISPTTTTIIRSAESNNQNDDATPSLEDAKPLEPEIIKRTSVTSSSLSSSKEVQPESKYLPRQEVGRQSHADRLNPRQLKSSPPSSQQQPMVSKDPPAVSMSGSRNSNSETKQSATPTNRFATHTTSSTSRQSVAATAKSTASSTVQSNAFAAPTSSHHLPAAPKPQALSTSASRAFPSGRVERRDGGLLNTTNVKLKSNLAAGNPKSMNGAASVSANSAKPPLTKKTTVVSNNHALHATKPNGNHHLQQPEQPPVKQQHEQQQYLTDRMNNLTLTGDSDDDNSVNVDVVDGEDDAMDVEPLQGKEYVDASCLTSGSLISIRSTSELGMHLSIENNNDGDDISGVTSALTASLKGMGLGVDTEVFRLEAVPTLAMNNNSESSGVEDSVDNNTSRLLFYGDDVTLSCPGALGRAMGVRIPKQVDGKPVDNTTGTSVYQVGCFDPSEGLGQQWTILSANNRQRPLWVGHAAISSRPLGQNTHQAAMVRAGDSIVLRHCSTGGLLSLAVPDEKVTGIGHNGDCSSLLTLVTDSYTTNGQPERQHRQNRSSNHGQESLLSRLQHHDRMFPSECQIFQLIPTTSPPCPRWARQGLTFHSGSYLLLSERNESATASLAQYPSSTPEVSVQQQESLLLDEVIGSLIGLEGQYVRIRWHEISDNGGLEFYLVDSRDVTFHLSLRILVERILPLASAFAQVHAFAVRHSTESVFGSVMQAFCEALDGVLQSHVSTINIMLDQKFRRGSLNDQIEIEAPPPLTMKKLFTVVQPALQTMLVLQATCACARDKKGGSLLNSVNRLRNQSYAGDSSAQRLIDALLDKASVPYMELLTSWLQTGTLDDPYNEFLVERVQGEQVTSEPGYNGDTWNEMFVIRNENVLSLDFASSDSTLQKVLWTGKYWNAVGAVGRLDETSTKQDGALQLSFRMDSVTYLSFVDSMYQSSSQALVRLIRNEYNLFETLRTLKRYLLLDQGDFFVNFLDTAEEELSKRASQVSVGQIQHWLGMTIQLCETTGDRVLQVPSSRLDKPVASPLTPQLLRCRMASESLSEHLKSLHGQSSRRDSLDSLLNQSAYGAGGRGLTGVEAFILGFPHIPFPTSLVISPKAISAYQLLFRHLFIAKHIERRLVSIWRDQQVMKVFQSLQGALGPSNFLRQRMLHFCQNLIYYMMFEVIEPNWLEMGQGVLGTREEQTVDSIIDCHNDFLSRTLDACLLTNYDFIRILTKLMTTCLRFADLMKSFVEVTRVVSSCTRSELRGIKICFSC